MGKNNSEMVVPVEESTVNFYWVQFRPGSPVQTVVSSVAVLAGATVMVATKHGVEPAVVVKAAPVNFCKAPSSKEVMKIVSSAKKEERQRYDSLKLMEEEGYRVCCQLIEKHRLRMKLVQVERFFDGSKMIFYFTAESRVDFRTLVKDLVQQFRTRIEMRQIGVRHETQMLGGLGLCGREFCCSSWRGSFSSVSIKMAKEQELPLNPNKISGVCNRLFCCLAHEYSGYKEIRRKMPKPGRKIVVDNEQVIVRRQNVIRRQLLVENSAGEELVLSEEEWASAVPVKGRSEKRKQ